MVECVDFLGDYTYKINVILQSEVKEKLLVSTQRLSTVAD